MATYRQIVTAGDFGPWVSKLVLDLPGDASEEDVHAEGFNVFCERHVRATGEVLMRKEAWQPQARPSRGYVTPKAAYPANAAGNRVARGGHIALELTEERLNKTIEGDFVYGMVTNTASVAGMINMKNFLLDDGIFEVTLIRKPKNAAELGKTALALLKNDMTDKNIVFFRTDEVTITNLSDKPFSWTRDGEYGGEEVVNRICCHKKAVPFMVRGKSRLPFEKDRT